MVKSSILRIAACAAVALAAGAAIAYFKSLPESVDARLLEIAREYREWRQVDDQSVNWAPTFCRPPTPAAPRFSDSDDAATHGAKLYRLFAKDRAAYLALGSKEGDAHDRDGQVVVKESWTIKPAPEIAAQAFPPDAWDAAGTAYAQRNGRWYRTDRQADLFIMLRVDPATPESDDGWIYATVSPDGRTVTSAGRIESCMQCHQQAPHGRLFGLKSSAD